MSLLPAPARESDRSPQHWRGGRAGPCAIPAISPGGGVILGRMPDVPVLVAPDPALATARIELRPFRPDDAHAVAEACQDSEIPRFTFMPADMTAEQARDWIDEGLMRWPQGVARFAITLVGNDHPVGEVGVAFEWANRRAEAFYWIERRSRRLGLASEALKLATRWAFDQPDILRVHLLTHTDNVASHRVAERCGFTREGVLRSWEPVKDAQPDVVMWSRLAADTDREA